jgi:hypothetical protein
MFKMFLLLITQILAIGERCATANSLWDQAYCAVLSQPAKFQANCYPQRNFPDGANAYSTIKDAKGVIILYHGFSACPDAFSGIIEELNRNGYVTLAPLLPGHGIEIGYGCENPNSCLASNTNPSLLPNNRSDYMNWVDWSLDMLRQEVSFIPSSLRSANFVVGALGLSAGGPVVTYAAGRPQSPITKVLTVNPFYSVTYPPLDFRVQICKTAQNPSQCVLDLSAPTINMINVTDPTPPSDQVDGIGSLGSLLQVVRTTSSELKDILLEQTLGNVLSSKYDAFMTSLWSALTTIHENPALLRSKILDNPFGWGNQCFSTENRGGICEFRMRNLLALHAFAQFSIANLDSIPKTTKFAVIHSDLDGPSRDSVSSAVVSHLQSKGLIASKCRYELKCPIEKIAFGQNTCGVPHSSFSRAEAVQTAPYEIYWERDLFQNILNFFQGITASVGSIGETIGSYCGPVSDTAGFGPEFDIMGPKYIQQSIRRFQ